MRIWTSLILLLLASCATPVQQGPRVRIAIGGQAQIVYLPTTLAERLGHYRAQGLEVELIEFAGGAKALEALLGGSADVVSGFFDHTIQMAAEGKQMKAFVAMLKRPGLALVSTGRVRSVADLKGKVVGVSAPGSSTHMLLNRVLRGRGIAPDSVAAAGVGMAAGAVAAMEHGKVDAAVMAEPALSQLAIRLKQPLVFLADTRTAEGTRELYAVDDYPASVFYSSAEWIAKNPEIARRLALAMQETLKWIHAHTPAEISKAMPEPMKLGGEEAYVKAIESSMDLFSRDGRLHAQGMQAVARVLAEDIEKVGAAKVDPQKCYTDEFLQ